MKKYLFSGVVLIVALLLVTSSALAVTWGVPDNGEHPYVGTLLFRQGGGWYSCSGTLLDATTVLTAGHCVQGGGVVNDETYFLNEEDVLSTRLPDEPLADWAARAWIKASVVYPHPQYDDYAQFPSTYDVGIVKLSSPITLTVYGQLPPANFLETLKGQDRKGTFTVVGYGMQGVLNPFYSDLWMRYKGTVSLVEINSNFNAGMSAKFTNNPGKGGGSGGSCFGDSGGPVFWGSGPMVVAVVSWGITPCIGVDYQFRVDTPLALDFIDDYYP